MLESGHSRRYSRAMTDSSTANPLLAPNHALPDFGAIRAEDELAKKEKRAPTRMK